MVSATPPFAECRQILEVSIEILDEYEPRCPSPHPEGLSLRSATALRAGSLTAQVRMDGWLDGWMAGWLDGWMAGWLDGRMAWWLGGHGWMDGFMDGWHGMAWMVIATATATAMAITVATATATAAATAIAIVTAVVTAVYKKWEVLLEVRLQGTTFWYGLSNHQAATAQMHLVETNILECRPLLGALPLSLTVAIRVACRRSGAWAGGDDDLRALSSRSGAVRAP